jgi:hypothetical protein|tara:strand:+ start:74 stop:589 length:516 start_codon:yes stop_codon:yes gene_type:complete
MAPKLKVEIRETVTLQNNNKYDAYNRFTLDGINHVDKRIVRIPTSGTEILALSGSVGAGTFNEENVRYMRFTNLSTNNPIMLEFKNEDGDTFVTKVGQGLSFIYSGASGSGVINTMDANESVPLDINDSLYSGLGDLVNVVAKASGSSVEYAGSTSGSVYNVDMEIFVAAI